LRYECVEGFCDRRSNLKDAQLFAEKWGEVHRYRKPPYAAEMDNMLHAERSRGRVKRLHRRNIDELPDAAFIAFDGTAFAVRGDTLLHWTPDGYDARQPRPRRIAVDVLTPPAIVGNHPAASGVSTVSSVIGGLSRWDAKREFVGVTLRHPASPSRAGRF
jgi:hypothetical protein